MPRRGIRLFLTVVANAVDYRRSLTFTTCPVPGRRRSRCRPPRCTPCRFTGQSPTHAPDSKLLVSPAPAAPIARGRRRRGALECPRTRSVVMARPYASLLPAFFVKVPPLAMFVKDQAIGCVVGAEVGRRNASQVVGSWSPPSTVGPTPQEPPYVVWAWCIVQSHSHPASRAPCAGPVQRAMERFAL